MDDNLLLTLLKFDLNRGGANLGDDVYLKSLLRTARDSLARQGIAEDNRDEYMQLAVGTAAWMYRKRINGEAEPNYLRRLRHNLIVSETVKDDA